ncbi:MAG: hypothetical protein R2737_01260 [Candidatus Nanopelagicales bacterium]
MTTTLMILVLILLLAAVAALTGRLVASDRSGRPPRSRYDDMPATWLPRWV